MTFVNGLTLFSDVSVTQEMSRHVLSVVCFNYSLVACRIIIYLRILYCPLIMLFYYPIHYLISSQDLICLNIGGIYKVLKFTSS